MYPTGVPANTVSQNDPSLGYIPTAIMGNTNFSVQTPPTKGEVQTAFPQIPYVSIQAEIFFNSMANPQSAPYTTMSGSNTGQQVLSGQLTQQDATGTSRYLQGYQSVNS